MNCFQIYSIDINHTPDWTTNCYVNKSNQSLFIRKAKCNNGYGYYVNVKSFILGKISVKLQLRKECVEYEVGITLQMQRDAL